MCNGYSCFTSSSSSSSFSLLLRHITRVLELLQCDRFTFCLAPFRVSSKILTRRDTDKSFNFFVSLLVNVKARILAYLVYFFIFFFFGSIFFVGQQVLVSSFSRDSSPQRLNRTPLVC